MLIVTELTLYLDHDCQSEFCKLAIFSFLVTVYTLRKYSNTHKKPSSAYNKNENQFFAYKQQRQQKTSQWIIRGDEIQRKPSLHTHTHRCWSTPTLIFPYSQPYLQVTYGCMQSEPPPSLPAVGCPELYYTQGVGLSDLLCWAGRCMF